MATSVRDILINLIGKETISPAAKRSGKALGDLGDEMGDAAKAAKSLDREIGDVQKSLKQLAIASTSGEDVKKQIREQERALRDLNKRRKLLGDIDLGGGEAAEKFALSFGGRIGPLMARAPISPGLLAATAVAAPMVANVVAGAVTGAIGGGAVVAGLALAARDERVQAEAKGLADEVGSVLSEAAGPFVPATVKAIGIVRDEFRSMDDDLEDIFGNAARYVEPLARGAAGFVGEMVPGIRDAVAEGEPFFSMLERELPELGRDVGELFSTMADHAEDGAEAVGKILDTMGAVADVTGGLVDVLDVLMAIGSFDPTSEESWDNLKSSWDKLVGNEGKLVKFKEEADGAAGGIRNVGNAASESSVKVELLTTAIDRMSGQNLTAREAVRNLKAAYDAATEAVKKNGETLDEGTPKGRANAAALDDIVRKAKAARDAIIAQKGSQGEANEVMDRARTRFIETAHAMGMAIPEAKKLADALFGIPSVNPKVKVDTKTARNQVTAYKEWLRSQNLNKTSTITVRQIKESQSARGGNKEFAHGGPITGPGPKGVDSVSIVAAPGEHVWTAAEVDAAGGHAAVERLRKSVLSGGKASTPAVASVSGGMAGPVALNGVLRVRSDGTRAGNLAAALIEFLQPEIRIQGGVISAFERR